MDEEVEEEGPVTLAFASGLRRGYASFLARSGKQAHHARQGEGVA